MTQATQQHARDEVGRHRVVFLLDACSGIELRILQQWIAEHHVPTGIPWDAIPIPPTRRRGRRTRPDSRLEAALTAPDDPMLTPLRVVWVPGDSQDGPRRRFVKLLLLGDPRDPGRMRQAVGARQAARYQVVAGEAAPVTELRERWRRAGGADRGETTGLAEFVTRAAALALERAERRVRGLRYKVPRFVREDILARPSSAAGRLVLAEQVGKPEAAVLREAERYLGRDRRHPQPPCIDLTRPADPPALHARVRRGPALRSRRAERIYALAQRYPVVFPAVAQVEPRPPGAAVRAVRERPSAQPHGGRHQHELVPVGPLVRAAAASSSSARTVQGQSVYKFVLQSYIDYLIEKRFSLECAVASRAAAPDLASCRRRASGCSPTWSTRTGAARARTSSSSRWRSPMTRSRTSARTRRSSTARRSRQRASAGS
jgi:glycerol-3-phosphate O-acyltransferase